jgi:hypothetical protein
MAGLHETGENLHKTGKIVSPVAAAQRPRRCRPSTAF